MFYLNFSLPLLTSMFPDTDRFLLLEGEWSKGFPRMPQVWNVWQHKILRTSFRLVFKLFVIHSVIMQLNNSMQCPVSKVFFQLPTTSLFLIYSSTWHWEDTQVLQQSNLIASSFHGWFPREHLQHLSNDWTSPRKCCSWSSPSCTCCKGWLHWPGKPEAKAQAS